MLKRWNRKAQYYLVAAMIIGALIITIATVMNYSKKSVDPGLNDLKEEIQIESAGVLDYATNKQLSSAATKQTLLDFTQNYIDYLGTSKSLYFIFGNSGEITVSGYQESDKTVLIDSIPVTSTSGNFTKSIAPTGDEVTLSINSDIHDFEITPGENFYFVLSDTVGNEEHIIQG